MTDGVGKGNLIMKQGEQDPRKKNRKKKMFAKPRTPKKKKKLAETESSSHYTQIAANNTKIFNCH